MRARHIHAPHVPHPGRDRIHTAAQALAVVAVGLSQHPEDETIAFFLDDTHRGNGLLLNISGTGDPESAPAVVELLAEIAALQTGAGRPCASLVLATVRSGGGLLLPDDGERWVRCSDLADATGVTLLEWFVITGHQVRLPRELTGEPDRWPIRTRIPRVLPAVPVAPMAPWS
jgi:hypothetical protein